MKRISKIDWIIILVIILIISSIIIYFYINEHHTNDKSITVGTFNIEWLGDGINDRKPRTEEDYKLIAQVISDTDADILGLQEIENEQALLKVLQYLPEYKAEVGELGFQQNVAIIYKHNIYVKVIEEYTPLIIEDTRLRPGLVAEVQKGNFDFIFKVVHFKSTSRFDNTDELRQRSYDLRTEQAEIVSNWADSILSIGKEQDLIIVGDFNCNPLREKNPTLMSIIDYHDLFFITENQESCKNPAWDSIDHIVISTSAKNRKIKHSVYSYNIYDAYNETAVESISDHCPVIVQFEIQSPDND